MTEKAWKIHNKGHYPESDRLPESGSVGTKVGTSDQDVEVIPKWFRDVELKCAEGDAESVRRALRLMGDHRASEGEIYFALCRQAQAVKIGWSLENPSRRIYDIEVGCPFSIDVAFVLRGTLAAEQELHRIFKALRIHHEWVHYEGALRSFMEYVREVMLRAWGSALDEITTPRYCNAS